MTRDGRVEVDPPWATLGIGLMMIVISLAMIAVTGASLWTALFGLAMVVLGYRMRSSRASRALVLTPIVMGLGLVLVGLLGVAQ